MADQRIAIGVDVGGSAIKAGAVDVAAGQLIGQRLEQCTDKHTRHLTISKAR